MSVAAQAIAARRKAKIDPRYIGQTRKSAAKRAARLANQLHKQKLMASRKAAK